MGWDKHILNYNTLGSLTYDNQCVVISTVYSKDELAAYATMIIDGLETMVIENYDPESGFAWIKLNKFELHLYNIRHIQHHTGQLIEQLHQNGISGINWLGRA